jgi:hypothetical protein
MNEINFVFISKEYSAANDKARFKNVETSVGTSHKAVLLRVPVFERPELACKNNIHFFSEQFSIIKSFCL